MKALNLALSLAALILPAAAMADQPAHPASLYTCQGDQDGTPVEILFTTTSFVGHATMSLVEAGTSRELSAPQVERTVHGIEVSSFDPNIADASINYTLIVPEATVNDDVPSHDVKGMLITTFAGGLFVPQTPRVVQSSTYTQLDCKAQFAVF